MSCGAQPGSAAARTASRIAASPALASATRTPGADSTLASTGANSPAAAPWAAIPAPVSWIRYERPSPGLGARRTWPRRSSRATIDDTVVVGSAINAASSVGVMPPSRRTALYNANSSAVRPLGRSASSSTARVEFASTHTSNNSV